jgi:indole-3-glycerol phosphate synthase
MSDFLKTMAELSAERARAASPALLSATFDKPLVPLQLETFDVIAEIKDRSPAEGELASDAGNRAERAQQYAQGGAVAISVLTEPSRFSGSLEHLEEVVAAVPGTPVMRKDFLVAPVQILEAREAGASGVLLIVTMLDDGKLREMLDCAWEHGMFVLLESFDSNDLARVDKLLENEVNRNKTDDGQLLIGINTRNLRTLEVDSNRLEKLASELPPARCVAESGLHTAQDAATVSGLGYKLALVGTALMRADDPAALVAQMRAAGSGRDVA